MAPAWAELKAANCCVPRAFRSVELSERMASLVSEATWPVVSWPICSDVSASIWAVVSLPMLAVVSARRSCDSSARNWVLVRLTICVLLMAAACAGVSATIWCVPKAVQSADVRLAIVLVDKPAIWAVDRLEMMEAMVTILVSGEAGVLEAVLADLGLLAAGPELDDGSSGSEAVPIAELRASVHGGPTT